MTDYSDEDIIKSVQEFNRLSSVIKLSHYHKSNGEILHIPEERLLPAIIIKTNVPDLSEWHTIELVPIGCNFELSEEEQKQMYPLMLAYLKEIANEN